MTNHRQRGQNVPSPIHRAAAGAVAAPRRLLFLVAIAALVLAGCGSGGPAARTISISELNDSGVSGTVKFSPVGDRTGVEVTVDPASNLDMPAHIHPGTCANLTPQPKYPLGNVRNGTSTTVVPASIDQLFAGNLAVNIHKSNDDLKTYTACVDIR
jgi:hypothetical protein